MKLRLFLASPGDVSYERQLALEIIDQVSGERAFRGQVSIEVIAWDKPGVNVPMEAGLTPQEAIARGLPKPAECDLVLVVLWSRIGTPLPARYTKTNGNLYLSGTEWEYENALEGFLAHGRPSVWVYRRTEEPKVGLDDPDRDEKFTQWSKIKEFFDLLTNSDGSLAGGVNYYDQPDAFRRFFELHLRDWLTQRIDVTSQARSAAKPTALATETPCWTGLPYPGLKAFTEEQAPIFFGRGREIDDLVARLADRQRRFLAVVGASGTGKSSLIMAGLLPSLRKNAIPGSGDWVMLPQFTPALEGSPLCGLGSAIVRGCNGIDEPRWALAERLAASPETFAELAAAALTGRPDWAELLVVVDQFEELLTLVPKAARYPFVQMLDVIAKTPRVRTLITLRADFAHRIDNWRELVDLRNGDGTYILKQPGRHALRRMIEGPAQLVGVTLQDGLPDRIIEDTGSEPGSLALFAFTLERLYSISRTDSLLTKDAYRSLDGVRGSIIHQADSVFATVSEPAQQALTQVFRELVSVREDGTATRRRRAVEAVTRTPAAAELVKTLVGARLLVAEEDGQVEVAHEKLFDAWDRLKQWISEYADDLRLIEKVHVDAADWEKNGRASKYLWGHDRLMDVSTALARLGMERKELDTVCWEFIRPEAERLLAELENPETSHNRRAWIGDRLAEIVDPRSGIGMRKDTTPDIAWVAIPGGKAGPRGEARVSPFHMARFLVTNAQFQAFVDAADGYRNPDWWKDMPENVNDGPRTPRWPEPNRPRETVSWYEAVAFCRWLSRRLGFEVRLPTESEWQQAATGGDSGNIYPWGGEWNAERCNTLESGLNRTVAVGLYPASTNTQGVYDLFGNLWEWCLNMYDRYGYTAVDSSNASRGLHGGSWDIVGNSDRAYYRYYAPYARSDSNGFRVVYEPPIVD